MSQDAINCFAFDAIDADSPALPPLPALAMGADQAQRALAYASQVSYHWDIKTDAIRWSANVMDVLAMDPANLTTGRHFAGLMDSENFFSRYDTVLRSNQRDSGDGVGYEIEYRLKANPATGTSGTWIEDTGRWFAGPDGSPVEALGIMRIANERHQRDQQMSFLSNCDPLTGMMNRVRLTEALGEAIEVAVSDKQPCAFAILAVNNLDVMNEAYGYEVADEVIVTLGQRLRNVMRMGDGIARYSGSKFAIILNSCKPDELTAALERFMRAVRDSVIETRFGPVWALLSIGAVSLPAMGDNASAAIAHAEEALSEAFRLPSDGHVVYTSSEDRKARRLLNARCATEIVACLRDGLFKLAFQPVFDTSTGEVRFHEALLRMSDTTGALITAGHLVPIAERLGLIRLIDRAVLQMALSTLQNYPAAKLSVNISATTVTDLRWNKQLLEMIAAAPEAASRLVIEITETAALDNLATSQVFCATLRQLGCGVALDDFGAGYTSYRNLKELALSHIKLDGSFCCNLSDGSDNLTFVKSMVDLGKAFGLLVIAEWVDTPEDADILARMGVDCLQGNLLGAASITPPWASENASVFAMEGTAIDPVDARYFTHTELHIEEPKQPEPEASTAQGTDAETTTASVMAEPAAPQKISMQDVAAMRDEELESEIAALQAVAPETTDFAIPLEPMYETALSQQPEADGPDVTVVDHQLAAAIVSADIPTTDTMIDVEDSLSQLRAALAELTSAFATADEERLAS